MIWSWQIKILAAGAKTNATHNDVINWNHFPRYWPFVRGNHRSPVNSPLKGQWRRALIYYLIQDWANGWVNNWYAGDLRRHCAHYDVTVISAGVCHMRIIIHVFFLELITRHDINHMPGSITIICISRQARVNEYLLKTRKTLKMQ